MGRSIWEVFQALFRWGESPDGDASEGTDDDRFVPSPLDLSVRIAHGGPDDTVVRELSEIGERARGLENRQREN